MGKEASMASIGKSQSRENLLSALALPFGSSPSLLWTQWSQTSPSALCRQELQHIPGNVNHLTSLLPGKPVSLTRDMAPPRETSVRSRVKVAINILPMVPKDHRGPLHLTSFPKLWVAEVSKNFICFKQKLYFALKIPK